MAKLGLLKSIVKDNATAKTALAGYLVVDTQQDGMNGIGTGHAIFQYNNADKAIYVINRDLVSGKDLDPKENPVVVAGTDVVHYAKNVAKFPIEGIHTGTIEVKEGNVDLATVNAFLTFIEGALNWGDYVSFQNSEAYVVETLDDLGDSNAEVTTKAPEETTKAP